MSEKLKIPSFSDKKELFEFLKENLDQLKVQKFAENKQEDSLGISPTIMKDLPIVKAIDNESNKDYITVEVIINTTNIMDSHKDVHIPGLWKKTIKENKRILHVQEHKSNEFDKIISSGDDLEVYTKTYTWKELGFDSEGKTEALVFKSIIRKDRNEYMFNQYIKNWVDNHSVGMRYVKLELAINDKEYEKEKDFWDKYIGEVVNRKDAETQGYFWVVTEAKVIEGSAVPNGSNPITPTISQKVKKKEVDKDLNAYKSFLGIETKQ